MTESKGDLQAGLDAWASGDAAALDALVPQVYEELRRLAGSFLRRERRDHTLQTTALVHEAYLRLVGQRQVPWQSRAQLLGLAARMMRRILVNHAEARRSAKRGGGRDVITLSTDLLGQVRAAGPALEVEALHAALGELEALDPRQGRVVELRYFGGLSIEETAEVLDVSPATVKREWAVAKLFLQRAVASHAAEG